jgi:diamine N-acetyltransferase
VKQYLENAHQDIYEAKQLRLVCQDQDFPALGLIDLFDFDQRIIGGVGIVMGDDNRNKKY